MTTLFAILGTLVSTLGSALPQRVCSIAALPIFRDPTATYLVGTATPDTALATPGGPAVGLPGLAPAPRPAVYGQLVRVDQFAGPDAAHVERAFTRRGSRDVIIVPWGFGAACEPIAWSVSARWAHAGKSATYRLHLRPEAEWTGGPPVFDALRAELQPYPHGVLAPRASDGAALTPEEFMELYLALPTERAAAARPALALRAFDEWAQAHPHLIRHFPAATVLRNGRAFLTRSP